MLADLAPRPFNLAEVLRYIRHYNYYRNISLYNSKPKERYLARAMSKDKYITMNSYIYYPIIGRKLKNFFPISYNPIVADKEKTTNGFLVSRAI